MIKELKVFTTLVPVVGSLGYLYYLGSNGQVKLNVSLDSDSTQHVKRIFDLRVSMESDDRALFKKMMADINKRTQNILFEDNQLSNKFGSVFDLEFAQTSKDYERFYQDYADSSKSTTQSVLNLKRKRELLPLSQVVVKVDIKRSNLYFIFPRINCDISSIDFQTNVNKKPGNPEATVFRKFEKLELKKESDDQDTNYAKIKKSKHISQPELFLNTLSLKKTDNQSVLNFVRELIEDTEKLNKFGRPLKLTYVKSFNDDKNQKHEQIKVEGKKETAVIEIISDTQYTIKQVNAYYDIAERLKSLPTSTLKPASLPGKIASPVPVAHSTFLQKYTKHDVKLERVLQDIKLNEVIDKQAKLTKEISSIGKPFKISIDPRDQLVTETEGTVRIHMDGRLNQGELTLKVKRASVTESWSVVRSDIKVLWNVNETRDGKAKKEINIDDEK